MIQISKILNGWANFITKPEVVEEKAKERAAICAACPYAKQGKLLTFVKDTLSEVQGAYCEKCGCPLSAKVRSVDICPIGKWQ